MGKVVRRILIWTAIVYAGLCTAVFIFQEKLIFFPQKLSDNYVFESPFAFEEVSLKSETGNILNGLHFKSDSSTGLVLYFHGNAGSLASWKNVAEDFIPLNMDLLVIDYAGYGKSKGKLSEHSLFLDAQAVYDYASAKYSQDRIVVYGRSIGTGIAARLASENNPRSLILEAPYFSMTDLASHLYPLIPSFLLRYPLRTDLFLPKAKCPVTLIHGTEDEVIHCESSRRLQTLLKPGDRVVLVEGAHHNDLSDFTEYQTLLRDILK